MPNDAVLDSYVGLENHIVLSRSNTHVLGGCDYYDNVTFCHCERPKGAKQSQPWL